MTALLSAENLVAGYGAGTVLHGVNLQIGSGEVVVVLGANGAGKTTLFRALTGLLPCKGTVRFEGRSILGEAPEEIARHGIAHVPQGRGTFANLTVAENLKVGAHTRRDGEVDTDIERMYDRFPVLGERRSQMAGSLSGGEQQMLAIARALMLRPRLLLLDEPSLGLAPVMTQSVFEFLTVISSTADMSMLIAEQNAQLALSLADVGYLIEAGQIQQRETAAELLNDDRIQKFYLGH